MIFSFQIQSRLNFALFNKLNVGQFSWSWFILDSIQVQKKKKKLKIRNSVLVIELRSYISRRGRSVEVKEIFQKDTILRSCVVVVVL